jgi:diaminopimelate decarboxylase
MSVKSIYFPGAITMIPKLQLFPLTVEVDNSGHLFVGGCDCIELVKEFGTPLYIFDEFTLRAKCKEFQAEFSNRYKNMLVAYASKAFLNRAIAGIVKEEGLGLDVVSGGELSIAGSVDFPSENIFFHGNNKTPDELNLALERETGRIVVDSFHEMELLGTLAHKKGTVQKILLRITPGIDAHTHKKTTTGILDSKFGFPMATGQAATAIEKALANPGLELTGIHFHLGSPLFETSPYELAIEATLSFVKDVQKTCEFHLQEFSTGGGFAVQYTVDSPVPGVAAYAEVITNTLKNTVRRLDLDEPRLIIEPGRAISSQAGIALYTVGAIKEIPDVRTYVCVDGGMGDNIRPAFYESKYEAIVANRIGEKESSKVTVAGKYCESGDILARDINISPVNAGDIIAIPVCGSYSIPMSSNYNMVPRPAIILVHDKKARIIRKRESYDDLMRLDIP